MFDSELSVNEVSQGGMRLRGPLVPATPFGSFDDREPHALFPGVGLKAVAGDQVFLGRVTYAPGRPSPATATSTPSR